MGIICKNDDEKERKVPDKNKNEQKQSKVELEEENLEVIKESNELKKKNNKPPLKTKNKHIKRTKVDNKIDLTPEFIQYIMEENGKLKDENFSLKNKLNESNNMLINLMNNQNLINFNYNNNFNGNNMNNNMNAINNMNNINNNFSNVLTNQKYSQLIITVIFQFENGQKRQISIFNSCRLMDIFSFIIQINGIYEYSDITTLKFRHNGIDITEHFLNNDEIEVLHFPKSNSIIEVIKNRNVI